MASTSTIKKDMPRKVPADAQSSPLQVLATPGITSNSAEPASTKSVPHEIYYREEAVQEDAKYRVQWIDWMSDGTKKSFYRNVFVLLLSWHPECDDLAVDEEVKRLKHVFEETYNYTVESFYIDSRLKKLPQIQANHAVSTFVHTHDEAEDSLFIVYYAGHGSPGKIPGDLKMSGRRRHDNLPVSHQFSHITWNYVESNLKETRADVLLIFDCCHSNDLGRDSSLTSRSFEYLAASTSAYTRSPGQHSFTSALIWALEKLAVPASRGASKESPLFTTTKLADTIFDAPDFPRDQKPSLQARDIDACHRIILAPLPREGDSRLELGTSADEASGDEDEGDDDVHPQYLSLTFHFKRKQSGEELKKLSDHLKRFMKMDDSSLYKVHWDTIWGGTKSTPAATLRYVIRRLMATRQSVTDTGPSRFQSSLFLDSRISSTQTPRTFSDTASTAVNEDEGEGDERIAKYDNEMKGAIDAYEPEWIGAIPGYQSANDWSNPYFGMLQLLGSFFVLPLSAGIPAWFCLKIHLYLARILEEAHWLLYRDGLMLLMFVFLFPVAKRFLKGRGLKGLPKSPGRWTRPGKEQFRAQG